MRISKIPKIKCQTCGRKFPITAGDKYYAKKTFIFGIYECFDCIYCGCQNVVNERMSEVNDL